MKNNKVLGWILTLLFIAFAIVLVIQLILKLTSKSPTDIQILYVIVGAIISYLLVMSYKIGTFVGEVREFMTITKNIFVKLREEKKK